MEYSPKLTKLLSNRLLLFSGPSPHNDKTILSMYFISYNGIKHFILILSLEEPNLLRTTMETDTKKTPVKKNTILVTLFLIEMLIKIKDLAGNTKEVMIEVVEECDFGETGGNISEHLIRLIENDNFGEALKFLKGLKREEPNAFNESKTVVAEEVAKDLFLLRNEEFILDREYVVIMRILEGMKATLGKVELESDDEIEKRIQGFVDGSLEMLSIDEFKAEMMPLYDQEHKASSTDQEQSPQDLQKAV